MNTKVKGEGEAASWPEDKLTKYSNIYKVSSYGAVQLDNFVCRFTVCTTVNTVCILLLI